MRTTKKIQLNMSEEEIKNLARREVNKMFIPEYKHNLVIVDRLRYYDMYEEGIKKGIELCQKEKK